MKKSSRSASSTVKPRKRAPLPACSPPFRALREALGLTQQALADQLEIDRTWLSFLESGDFVPSARLVIRALDLHRKVLDRAGITPEDLVRGTFKYAGRPRPGQRRIA